MVVHRRDRVGDRHRRGPGDRLVPEPASTQAGPIDTLYDVLHLASVPIFVLVTVVVLFCVVNFRMRPGEEQLDGPPIHGNTRLEVIWTAIPAIILVVLCAYAYVVLDDIEEAQADEMRVNVIGQQFAWTFEYPQAGGKPIKSNQLYLPKDRPVRFYVKALDVIHDFWVPAFRMKIDAVPGIETNYRVTPNRLGTYPVVCAELCGLGHAFMRQTARVVTPADFDEWIAEQKAPAQAAGGGGAEEADGKTLFTDGNGTATACGACHTLADAGTSGETGPDLDETPAGQGRGVHPGGDRRARRRDRARASRRGSCRGTTARPSRPRSSTPSWSTSARSPGSEHHDEEVEALDGRQVPRTRHVPGGLGHRPRRSRSRTRSSRSSGRGTTSTRSSTARRSSSSR